MVLRGHGNAVEFGSTYNYGFISLSRALMLTNFLNDHLRPTNSGGLGLDGTAVNQMIYTTQYLYQPNPFSFAAHPRCRIGVGLSTRDFLPRLRYYP